MIQHDQSAQSSPSEQSARTEQNPFPSPKKSALMMYVYHVAHNYSFSQIAKMFQISESSVRYHISRFEKAIKKKIFSPEKLSDLFKSGYHETEDAIDFRNDIYISTLLTSLYIRDAALAAYESSRRVIDIVREGKKIACIMADNATVPGDARFLEVALKANANINKQLGFDMPQKIALTDQTGTRDSQLTAKPEISEDVYQVILAFREILKSVQSSQAQPPQQPTAAHPTAAHPTAAHPTAAQPTAVQPTAPLPATAQPTATQSIPAQPKVLRADLKPK